MHIDITLYPHVRNTKIIEKLLSYTFKMYKIMLHKYINKHSVINEKDITLF